MLTQQLGMIVKRNSILRHYCLANLKESCVFSKSKQYDVPKPELDINYLCDVKNKEEIELNVRSRKGVGNIQRVHELYATLNDNTTSHKEEIEKDFLYEALCIPNKSHPSVQTYGDDPKVVNEINSKREFDFKPYEFKNIAKYLNLLRIENLGNFCGPRSYFLLGDLAELEQALIKFTVQNLLRRNFKLISVPDILPRQVIEACGMSTRGIRTQVYELDPKLHSPDMVLSGTSEMALAGYLMNKEFSSDELPHKLAAVSRCYRAEVSGIAEEKGIYRVHQFTKVEMFGVTDQKNSENLLKEFLGIQEQSFSALGLHLRTLDMPPHELGAPAYRKYDVEAWLPGQSTYGEVSSCSDCTDYQSRRLNIKYKSPECETTVHAYTINGTACAVPRMLIALLETHQKSDGTVDIPDALQPYMRGKKIIAKRKDIPYHKFIKTGGLEKT